MHPLHEFLFQEHAHIFESIRLADEKAAAIAAINTGVLYLFFQALKKAKDARPPLRWVRLTIWLLALGIAGSMVTWFPPSGWVDTSVKGGDLVLPHKIFSNEKEYADKLMALTDEQKTTQLVALVLSRVEVRRFKFRAVALAIAASGAGYLIAIWILAKQHLRMTEANATGQQTK